MNPNAFKAYTLKEAVALFGTSGISLRSLRREIHAGRLRAIRSRPGRNSKILILHSELERWIKEVAALRQFPPRED